MSVIAVGDPINVATGVQFDVALDVQIVWDIPFVWRRHYDSGRSEELLPLGWGHTHSYDHRLVFDLDGLTYTAPSGARYAFPLPDEGNPLSLVPGARLEWRGGLVFRVKAEGEPLVEFEFPDATQPARLMRLFRGADYQECHYGPDGRWAALAYGDAPPVRVRWDESGRIVALDWEEAPGKPPRRLWEGTYDAAGNLVRVVDVHGSVQGFGYDERNRMVTRTDRRGYSFAMRYDAEGRCVWSAGEDGVQAVSLHFDTAAKRTLVTRADGGAWEYHHEDGRVHRIVDPYGGVTRRSFGPDGRVAEEVGPEGEVLRRVLDPESGFVGPPFGPPGGMCLPQGDPWFAQLAPLAHPRTPMGWDGFGAGRAVSAITLPDREAARTWSVHLPPAALACLRFAEPPEPARRDRPRPPRPSAFAALLDQPRVPPRPDRPMPKKPMLRLAAAGEREEDAFGLLLGHAQPDGSRCRWRYDRNGNVLRHVDYAGSEWRFTYASWNLLAKESDPLGAATRYAYNTVEQVLRVEDAKGTATGHEYDLKDRMTSRSRDGTLRDWFRYDLSAGLVATGGPEEEPRISFLPGPHGRPLVVAPKGQPERRCSYDERGRLLGVAVEEGLSLEFAYDRVGHRTKDMQGGRGVERRYEGLRLVETTVLGRFATQYRRDGKGGGWTITDPAGGRHLVRQIDTGVFLLERANGVREVAQYDWNGRCLAKARFRGGEPFPVWARSYRYSPVGTLGLATDSASGARSYSYDAAHRLIGVAGPRGETEHYALDPAGNLLSAPGLRNATYAGNRLVEANGRRFAYTARDHVLAEWDDAQSLRYRYDAEDRLVECETPRGKVGFAYDALGRRVAKTSAAGRTEFIWDGERLAAEIGPGGGLRVYVYADGEAMSPFAFLDYAGVDSDPAAGVLHHVFTNQLACPVLVEDADGRTLWRAEIAAYGQAEIAPGARIALNLRWPGHYFDEETGLHYNRHRYYSPSLCRYLQVDPRDIAGGINLYAYPARPLDTVDVDGLAPCPKKPMVAADEDDPNYKAAKQEAEEVANNMRRALQDAVDADEMHPLNAAGVTLATMVVRNKDGTYEVVVTGNVNPSRMPQRVVDEFDGLRVVGHGDDRPPPVGQGNDDWRYPRTRQDGTKDESTHRHAEQRGLRAVDCDDNAEGVAFVAPTRPCCEGCSTAIQTPSSPGKKGGKSGWGGDADNVSDFGRQPGKHGDHW